MTTTATATAAATTQNLPPTARTLIFDVSTKTLHLEPSRRIPIPDPSKHDHLIRVQTTALCQRENEWPILFADAIFADNPEKQVTPGYDLAGTVITAPPGSPFRPGDEIYARTRPDRPGNSREYTIGRTSELALKPKSLDWVQAASVPLSAITAWQALFEHSGLVGGLNDPNAKGKKVLVTAAAGGVGVWLVQLASIAGMEVVAQIGSAENERFIRELGATETINYKTTDLKEWAEKEGRVDLVIDCIGGKTLEQAWFCVKDGGTLISIVDSPAARKAEGVQANHVKSLFFIMLPKGEQLAEISKLLEKGKCRPVVDSVWELEDFDKAFEKLDGGHAKGKIVLKIAK